tara:strand:- start:110 stop:985 length:876 start_codon:yes stop_codon:yes gene_type:complete
MKISEYKIKFIEHKIENSYLHACNLDINCIKPGNVNIHTSHIDTTSEDFITSYTVTSKIIASPKMSLGERIENSIIATKNNVKTNTNLGIILLCSLFSQSLSLKKDINLAEAIRDVVLNCKKKDLSKICNAITIANPGGLGTHEKFDVRSDIKITLSELMLVSSEYDQISRQYSLFFQDIFDFIIPNLHKSLSKISDLKLAISYTFLKTLAKYPDSHISRKYGDKIAKKTSNEAHDLLKILDGDTRHESWGTNLMSLDKHFKMTRVNPGATADLLVVSMMIYDYFIGLTDQ